MTGQTQGQGAQEAPAFKRTCGTCTLCCKVYDIPAVAKPMGKWCDHCDVGKGMS